MDNVNLSASQGHVDAIVFATTHYENFPVISFLIPKELKKHIAIIYWYARIADDIADEGNKTPHQRQDELDSFLDKFHEVLNGVLSHNYWAALKETINSKNLSINLFDSLISAFRQDTEKTRYYSDTELMDYCTRSANPVGRLLLELFGVGDQKAFFYSDFICSALQLVNFYQDVSVDYKKGRIYIPLSYLKKYNLSESDFILNERHTDFANMMEDLLAQAQEMFEEGKKLLPYLPFRLKLEIAATINGGLEIIKKIRIIRYQVSTIRPVLKKADYLIIGIKSIKDAIFRSKFNLKGK